MKYNKPHTGRLYGFGLLSVLVALGLFCLATDTIPVIYSFHWAVLALIGFMLLRPMARKRLAANNTAKPGHLMKYWILHILLLELSLLFIFLGIVQVTTHWLPVTTHIPSQIKVTYFFPWAIFAVYAARIAWVSYRENKDAEMSTVLQPLFHFKKAHSVWPVTLNLQARLATTLALASTFAMMTLLMMALFLPAHHPFLTGFHIKSTIIIMVLLLFGFTPPFKKLCQRLLNPKIPLFLSCISVLILFAALILLLNGLFMHRGGTTISLPTAIQWLEQKQWPQIWKIFSLSWWVCWTPLMASHLARLSRGQKMNHTLMVIMAFPILFSLYTMLFPQQLSTLLSHYHILCSLLALGGFIYLLWRITEKSALPILIRSYLPARDVYKRRDHYFYFRKLFQVMLTVIYLYLPAGIALTALLLFTLSLPFVIQILLSIPSTVRWLLSINSCNSNASS